METVLACGFHALSKLCLLGLLVGVTGPGWGEGRDSRQASDWAEATRPEDSHLQEGVAGPCVGALAIQSG